MSLIKQLWLAIIVVLSLALGGSLVISVLSARYYLEQQLQVKNIDDATAIALSLSQLPKDPVTIELQVSAQFDTGHYRFIRIVSPSGQTLAERVFSGRLEGAPAWFARLIPIQARPGQALVQDGWKQYGMLYVASHEQYAYRSLWRGMLELMAWFALSGLATGLLGTLGLRIIIRPLNDVVRDAESIAQRRFIVIKEPRTPELRAVVRAMNTMAERLKAVFSEEAERLEGLRRQVNMDAVTGLASRGHFLSHLHNLVAHDEGGTGGSLILIRLQDLNALNARLGHQRTDAVLNELGATVRDFCHGRAGYLAGRIKGGEVAVLCPAATSAEQSAAELHAHLSQDWLANWAVAVPDLVHIAAVQYRQGDPIGHVLSRADEALARAESQGPNLWYASDAGSSPLILPSEQWRSLLTEAVARADGQLAFLEVRTCSNDSVLHREAALRMQLDARGAWLHARDFMPMAARLHLSTPIDLHAIQLGFGHLRASRGDELALCLAAESIADLNFHQQLARLLQSMPALSRRLLFEVTEYTVFKHFDAFHDLVQTVRPLGCGVGLRDFGQRFADSHRLATLGLDYIKVHPSYLHGIAQSSGNQEFLRGLCTMARHFGITVIGLGVETSADLAMLRELGFDGFTGPNLY